MSKFTSGDWAFDVLDGVIDSTGETPRIVCLLLTNSIDDDYPTEEDKANGRLIASAPEMYELLKMLNMSSNDIEVSDVILKSKKLMARIDGREAEA